MKKLVFAAMAALALTACEKMSEPEATTEEAVVVTENAAATVVEAVAPAAEAVEAKAE